MKCYLYNGNNKNRRNIRYSLLYDSDILRKAFFRPVFFNLGSAEPTGSANSLQGSAIIKGEPKKLFIKHIPPYYSYDYYLCTVIIV